MSNLVLNLAFNQQTTSPGYRYADVSMPIEMDSNGKDLKVLHDIDSIKNGIANIFRWHPGERILNPEFGMNLEQFLYEPITDSTASAIKEYLQTMLIKWEPRISIRSITVEPFPDDNLYKVQLEWFVNTVPGSSTELFTWQLYQQL